jgi:hypothetical protein
LLTLLLLLLLLLQVDLPVDKGVVLLDIGFTGTDPNHGKQWQTRWQAGQQGCKEATCRCKHTEQ